MAIGKIAAFLSSLSPDADTAAAEQIPEQAERHAESLSQQDDLARDNRHPNANDIAAQLQTMVGAVRALNDNAVEQGAAVAVSAAGTQLKYAVSALGHLLSTVDSHALATGAAAPAREAASAVNSVEINLARAHVAAEQMIRTMSIAQALRAEEASTKFQADMRDALQHVRDALGSLNLGV